MTSTAYLPLLIDALARTVPADKDRSEDARKASLAEARTLFEAWQPADAMEAALAARAVAAHFAAMDSFARAAKPGMSDESVIRLRGNAIAAGRVFDNLRREFRRLRQPAPAEPQPRARGQASARDHGPDPVLPAALTDLVASGSRRADWRSGTALVAVQPTVPVPA